MLDSLFDLPDRARHHATLLLWHCGVYGRDQHERLRRWVEQAAVAAHLKATVEGMLLEQYPALVNLRDRVAHGKACGDDLDAFTPLEHARLRFAVWLREQGRIAG